jgi:hypothetical protein
MRFLSCSGTVFGLVAIFVRAASLSAHVRAVQRRNADKAIADLTNALHTLGIDGGVPLRVRVALRRMSWADTGGRLIRIFAVWLAMVWVSSLARSAVSIWLEGSLSGISLGPSWRTVEHYSSAKFGLFTATGALVAASEILTIALLVYLPIVIGWRNLMGTPVGISARAVTAVRYRLVRSGQQAVVACAAASRASNERLPTELAGVSVKLAAVSRDIASAHRTRDRLPRYRRQSLKKHGALVIGALRREEGNLDTQPREALRALALLLLQIIDRQSKGAYGSLLDREQLEGATPALDRETLRVVGVAVGFAAAGAGVAFLGAPEALQTYLLSGIGGCLIAIFYGGRTSQGFDVLDRIRGGR